MNRSALVIVPLFHLFHAHPALACGSTPLLLTPLLPVDASEATPRDAALIASSNQGPISFTLRLVKHGPAAGAAVDAGGALDVGGDAGDGVQSESLPLPEGAELTLDTECDASSGGNLCIAKPRALLEVGATYEWLVAGEDLPFVAPRRFTVTADVTDQANAVLEVRVTRNEFFSSHPCGLEKAVTFEFEAGSLVQPVVLNFKGVTPTYVTEPVVLTPEEPTQVMGVYSTIECFTLESIDGAGQRKDLREVCPDDVLAPTGQPPLTPVSSNDSQPAPSAAAETATPSSEDPASGRDGGSDSFAVPSSTDGTSVSEDSEAHAEGHGAMRGIDGESPSGGCAVSPEPHHRPFTWITALLGVVAGLGLRRRGVHVRPRAPRG